MNLEPLRQVVLPVPAQPCHRLLLAPLDRIHQTWGGNKAFKLVPNLEKARSLDCDTLLSFGGAWSNHIDALSAAGQHFGLKTIGVIRGERPARPSPTLRRAVRRGMQLHFVSREDYRRRNDPAWIAELLDRFGPAYVLPEGGSNELAVQGCEDIARQVEQQLGRPPDWLVCAVGTGATLAGLIRASTPPTRVLGVPVLKGADFLYDEIAQWIPADHRVAWSLALDYHFGGYARRSPELERFVREYNALNRWPIEPVYTGKMMYALNDLLTQGFFSPQSHIVAIHSGGLQYLDVEHP